MYHYKTHGTCSSEIELEIQNGIITHCKFIGGCKGNTQGLARMWKAFPAAATRPAQIS